MANVNGMQANMGLSGVYATSQEFNTPSPASVSLGLMAEAAQRQQQAYQIMESTPLGASSAFQQQYQQQMQSIQQQQSMNPYAARMFERAQASGSQQYLPSPITMTPPNSGVFRPPAPRPAMAPIAPVYTPTMPHQMFQPFTPQAPQPMFRNLQEQEEMQRVIRANNDFSLYSQAPGAIGYGAGIAAGAGAGALAGRRFGAWGALAGAGIGAIGAGVSGFAGGMEGLGQMMMRPFQQRQEMGAGIMNMSRNWVASGNDLNVLGRGLSRDASLNLASQVQNLASEGQFRKQTGEMFNSQDLMQIMRKGGESGLFDMSQDVPRIKEKLRETAGTIKQFMELTNDPSITSVIGQMGRLQQFGMNQQDMVTAARGMRSFARAAGTSIEGLQQIGGLPGAATFQQAGLTAGQGFQFGNFAAANANQMVAAGALTPRQLALMGGVQGMAQREMQSQAAFASMPLFAASQAQFSGGQWGVNPATVGRGDGAFGMVSGSMQAMNQAVQRGGIGALATFQMRQRELSDAALSQMTPMEQMAQKMKMAMGTGQALGLRGREALSVGGMTAFDAETANQMDFMASSPQFWENQRKAIRRRQLELGQAEAARNRDEYSMFTGMGEAVGLSGAGSWGRKTSLAFGEAGGTISGAGSAISNRLGDAWDEHIMGTDVITSRFDSGVSGLRSAAMRGTKAQSRQRAARMNAIRGVVAGGIDIDQDLLLQAAKSRRQLGVGVGETIGNLLGTVVAPGDLGTMGSGLATAAVTPRDLQRGMARKQLQRSSDFINMMEQIKTGGITDKGYEEAFTAIEGSLGAGGEGLGVDVIDRYAAKLDKRVLEGAEGELAGTSGGATIGGVIGLVGGPVGVAVGAAIGAAVGGGSTSVELTESEYREMAIESYMESAKAGGKPISRKAAEAKYNKLTPDEKKNLRLQGLDQARKRSKDKRAYDKLEGSSRKNRADQITSATNQRIAALRDDEAFKGVESALGLGSTLGIYTERDKFIQDLSARPDFGIKSLLAAKRSGAGDTDAITKQLKAAGIGSKEQAAIYKELDRMGETEEGRKALAAYEDMGAAGVSLEDLNLYGAQSEAIQTQTAFGSAGFRKSFGKYSGTLTEHLATSGSKAITGKSVAQQFTKEELAKMSKFGGIEGRRMAKLVERAQYSGSDEKRRQQALEAQGQITDLAAKKAEQDAEGVEKQAKVSAGGAEAKGLERDLKAIDEMAALFADFRPAIKEFAKGTRDLSAAMESDAMTRVLEGD